MKTKLFLLIGAILVSVMTFGQVDLRNSSSANIKATSMDGLNTLEVLAGQTASAAFLKEINGMIKVKIQHSAYRPGAGFNDVDDGQFSLAVNNGVAVFNSPKQRQADGSSASTIKRFGKFRVNTVSTPGTQPATVEKKTVNSARSNAEISPFMGMTSTFVVQNCCTMTITGYSGLLDGLCLKAKQTAKVKVTATTGLIQSAIGYDTDSDKIATGANQKWAVLYKSIPEGLDTLKIYNANLVLVNTGVQVTKIFNNRTPLSYLITNSKSSGTGDVSDKTVAPNSVRKMKFYLGWNVLTLQYKDEEGLPRQAALLFLVAKNQRVVNLTKKSGGGNSISDRELKIE